MTDLASPIRILYLRRVTDYALWDALALDALAARLAMELAEPLGKSTSLHNAMARLYDNTLRGARSADGQEGTARVLAADGWIVLRFTYRAITMRPKATADRIAAAIEGLGVTSGVISCGRSTVVVWGEFGRTPKINERAGRDHWPRVHAALMAGGGMKTGQVIGSTNKLAEAAADRPVHMQEVFATVYQNLGINVASPTIPDNNGRPQYLLEEDAAPLRELV